MGFISFVRNVFYIFMCRQLRYPVFYSIQSIDASFQNNIQYICEQWKAVRWNQGGGGVWKGVVTLTQEIVMYFLYGEEAVSFESR